MHSTPEEDRLSLKDLKQLTPEQLRTQLSRLHKDHQYVNGYVEAMVEMVSEGSMIAYLDKKGQIYLEPVVLISKTPAEA